MAGRLKEGKGEANRDSASRTILRPQTIYGLHEGQGQNPSAEILVLFIFNKPIKFISTSTVLLLKTRLPGVAEL